MATFRVELASAPNRDGQYSVRLRITANRKHKRLSLGFSIAKKDLNPKATLDKANWIRAGSTNSQLYNTRISQDIANLQQAITRLRQNNINPSVEQILEELNRNVEEGSFLDFFLERLAQSKIGLAVDTYWCYDGVYKKLIHFLTAKGRIKNGQPFLYFSEINLTFLKDFESFIRQSGCSINTTSTQLGYLQRFVTEAYNEELIKSNPYAKYTFKSEPIHRGYLNPEQIKKLEELELRYDRRIGPARDIWLFMYYTHGARIGDTLFLKVGDVVQVGDTYRLNYRMHKTKNEMSVKMSKQAVKLFLKYAEGKRANDFLFPFIKPHLDYTDPEVATSERKKKASDIDLNLRKRIAPKLGLEKLNCHMARHSFAQNSNDISNDLYAISKALGHKKIATTEIYLNELNQNKVDKVNSVYE